MASHPGQYYTLVCLSIISASLSSVCSGAIIAASWKDQSRSVYQKLIMALSAADLVGSFTSIFHSFLLPRRVREDGLLWASGNDATCAFAGSFFVSAYLLVSIFSLYLSAYFLAKVRYNTPDEVIAKRFLRPAIFVAVALCGSLGVVGIATHSFAPRVYHNVCSFGDCEIGKMDECEQVYETGLSWYLGWVQVALIALPALSALVLTVCVYVTVRARLSKGRRFVFGGDTEQQNFQRERLIAVRTQSLLYIGAYWNSFFWYFLYGVLGGDDFVMMEQQTEPFYFVLAVLCWGLFPLQGLVNFIVYGRPRYLQWRKMNPNKGRFFAMRKAISFEPVSATAHVRSTAETQIQTRRTTIMQLRASTDTRPSTCTALSVMRQRCSLMTQLGDTLDKGVQDDTKSETNEEENTENLPVVVHAESGPRPMQMSMSDHCIEEQDAKKSVSC